MKILTSSANQCLRRVSDLIDKHVNWKTDLIRQTFLPVDAELILKIKRGGVYCVRVWTLHDRMNWMNYEISPFLPTSPELVPGSTALPSEIIQLQDKEERSYGIAHIETGHSTPPNCHQPTTPASSSAVWASLSCSRMAAGEVRSFYSSQCLSVGPLGAAGSMLFCCH